MTKLPKHYEYVGNGYDVSHEEDRLAYLAATPLTQAAMLDQIEHAGMTEEGLGVTSHYLYIGRLRKG